MNMFKLMKKMFIFYVYPCRRLTALWMFCADNYLAPVYSECFKEEPALRDAIENFDVQKWKEVVQNMKACTFIKASEHFFAVRKNLQIVICKIVS